MPLEDRRGSFNRRDASNRRYPGQAPKRFDIPAFEAIQIIDYLKHQREHGGYEDACAYWKAMCRRYDTWTRQRLQGLLDKEDFYRKGPCKEWPRRNGRCIGSAGGRSCSFTASCAKGASTPR